MPKLSKRDQRSKISATEARRRLSQPGQQMAFHDVLRQWAGGRPGILEIHPGDRQGAPGPVGAGDLARVRQAAHQDSISGGP